MRIKLKAINSKPQVSLVIAVGRIELIADDLVDSAMLTAIARGLAGKGVALWDQIVASAKEVAREWRSGKESFEMKPPKRKAKV